VHLANGKISGGDCFITYGGAYQIDDDRFTATLTTKRHAAGPPTVFGLDEVEVKLVGKVNGTTACCAGSAEQAPGMTFEATLFFGEHPSSEVARKRPIPNLNADRLPKPARNRFARGLSSV
jgi:hypothetical protein